MVGIAQFKKNPKYLLNNNILRIALVIAASGALYVGLDRSWQDLLWYALPILLLSTAGSFKTGVGMLIAIVTYTYHSGFEALNGVYMAAAIVLTFPVTGLYHSCSHVAVKPAWLNRMLGELCGLWHTSSLDEWAIIHSFHHRYADDPVNDPHPPGGQGFFEYFKSMGPSIGRSFAMHYFKTHGNTPETQKIMKRTAQSIFVRQCFLSLFWFIALGPQAFAFLFATNIVFKKVHYVWFNWATHIKEGEKMTILNQEKGLYKLVNLISFNLYFHKNHHLRPGMLNPKTLAQGKPKEADTAA